jgi:hypothetical protein
MSNTYDCKETSGYQQQQVPRGLCNQPANAKSNRIEMAERSISELFQAVDRLDLLAAQLCGERPADAAGISKQPPTLSAFMSDLPVRLHTATMRINEACGLIGEGLL